MPDNWISRIYLTDETEIVNDDGEKIHDLIPCDQGNGVVVDGVMHPILWDKMGGVTGDDFYDTRRTVSNYWEFSSGELGGELGGAYGDSSVFDLYDDNGKSYMVRNQTYSSDGWVADLEYPNLGYTYEFEVRFPDLSIPTLIAYAAGSSNNALFAWKLELINGTIQLECNHGNDVVNAGAVNENEWTVITVCTDGNNYFLYINGRYKTTVKKNVALSYYPMNTKNGYPTNNKHNVHYGCVRISSRAEYDNSDYAVTLPFPVRSIVPNIPNISAPTGSPWPYKIIADLT